jgi:acetolactate synthase I/III small subunit
MNPESDTKTIDTQTRDDKTTIVALVENEPGVLNRIVSLFRRRSFNIDSLTVGRTHKPHVSRMTIVVDNMTMKPRIVAENLRKMVNVIDVHILDNSPHVARDLVLAKVRSDSPISRNTLTTICERYPARIIDIGPEVAIVEMTGTDDFVEEFIDALRPIGIVELIRTGLVAMGRGTRIHDTDFERPIALRNGNGKKKPNVI